MENLKDQKARLLRVIRALRGWDDIAHNIACVALHGPNAETVKTMEGMRIYQESLNLLDKMEAIGVQESVELAHKLAGFVRAESVSKDLARNVLSSMSD